MLQDLDRFLLDICTGRSVVSFSRASDIFCSTAVSELRSCAEARRSLNRAKIVEVRPAGALAFKLHGLLIACTALLGRRGAGCKASCEPTRMTNHLASPVLPNPVPWNGSLRTGSGFKGASWVETVLRAASELERAGGLNVRRASAHLPTLPRRASCGGRGCRQRSPYLDRSTRTGRPCRQSGGARQVKVATLRHGESLCFPPHTVPAEGPRLEQVYKQATNARMGKKSNQARFPLVRHTSVSLVASFHQRPHADRPLYTTGAHQKDDPAGRGRWKSRSSDPHRRL